MSQSGIEPATFRLEALCLNQLRHRLTQLIFDIALRTGRLYSTGNIPGIHFCQRLSRPQGHNINEKFQ